MKLTAAQAEVLEKMQALGLEISCCPDGSPYFRDPLPKTGFRGWVNRNTFNALLRHKHIRLFFKSWRGRRYDLPPSGRQALKVWKEKH